MQALNAKVPEIVPGAVIAHQGECVISNSKKIMTSSFASCHVFIGYHPGTKYSFMARIDGTTNVDGIHKIFSTLSELGIDKRELTGLRLMGGCQAHEESYKWGNKILEVLKKEGFDRTIDQTYFRKKICPEGDQQINKDTHFFGGQLDPGTGKFSFFDRPYLKLEKEHDKHIMGLMNQLFKKNGFGEPENYPAQDRNKIASQLLMLQKEADLKIIASSGSIITQPLRQVSQSTIPDRVWINDNRVCVDQMGCGISKGMPIFTGGFGGCYILSGADPVTHYLFLAHIDDRTDLESVRAIFPKLRQLGVAVNKSIITLAGGWRDIPTCVLRGKQIIAILKDEQIFDRANLLFFQQKKSGSTGNESYYPGVRLDPYTGALEFYHWEYLTEKCRERGLQDICRALEKAGFDPESMSLEEKYYQIRRLPPPQEAMHTVVF